MSKTKSIDQREDAMVKTAATKAQQIYECASEKFYVCGQGGNSIAGQYDPTLLFSILTGITNGNQLTYGNWGRGKTTSAETMISLIHGIPRDTIMACEAHGDPEITKEEYVAMPDLTDMSTIIWKSAFNFTDGFWLSE